MRLELADGTKLIYKHIESLSFRDGSLIISMVSGKEYKKEIESSRYQDLSEKIINQIALCESL